MPALPHVPRRCAPQRIPALPVAWLAALLLCTAGDAWSATRGGERDLPRAQELGGLSSDGAVEVDGQGVAFVHAELSRASVFPGEEVEVRLRFGFERTFQERSLIQPFRQTLDVPAQLTTPWEQVLRSAGLRVAVRAADAPDAAGVAGATRSLVVGSDVSRARVVEDVELDGRTYAQLELSARFRPLEAGPLRLPAPLLRFAYATSFHEGFLGSGRRPLDRVDAFVRGEALELDVRALPETGRPPDFSGATGVFTLRASAQPRDLRVGDTLRLALLIEGEGNLDALAAPRLDPPRGLALLGLIEEPLASGRRFVYELKVESALVREAPAVRLSYFDPTAEPPAYRTIESRPISVLVREQPPAPEAAQPGAPNSAKESDETERALAATSNDDTGAEGTSRWWLLAAPVLLLPVAFALARRRRRHAPVHDTEEVHRWAAEALHGIAEGALEPDRAFLDLIAAVLDTTPDDLAQRGLGARLQAAGFPEEVAAHSSRVVHALLEARYGHGAAGDARPSHEEIRALLEELSRTTLVLVR